VHNLLTAIITGGVLQGLGLNPTGQATAGSGAQGFGTQLGQNLQAGAARAVINTAINGGNLEDNLKNSLKTALLDTVAAQGANAIGNLSTGDGAVLNAFTNKVAHAIAGCAVGAVRADNSGGCGAGALGAAIGELAAEGYGRKADTVEFASMISAIAAAVAGMDAAQISLASAAGGNAAANNYLSHDQVTAKNAALAACTPTCPLSTINYWDNIDLAQTKIFTDSTNAKDAVGADPSAVNLETLQQATDNATALYEQFREAGDAGGMNTIGKVIVSDLMALGAGCVSAAAGSCANVSMTPAQQTIAMRLGVDLVTAVLPVLASAKASSMAGELGANGGVKITSDIAPTTRGVAQFGPMSEPGPLPLPIANTFRSGTYAETVTIEPTVLYRSYGGTANQMGGYWTTTPPSGPVQSIVDSALNPAWGNSATSVVKIEVPPGVVLYQGQTATQGGLVGGGNQVLFSKNFTINPNWIKQ